MRQFHKPKDEKRMIVILPRSRYDEWLGTSISRRIEFLKSFDEMDFRWIPKKTQLTHPLIKCINKRFDLLRHALDDGLTF